MGHSKEMEKEREIDRVSLNRSEVVKQETVTTKKALTLTKLAHRSHRSNSVKQH